MAETERSHWAYTLFVENAELYLPFLEKAKRRMAPAEIEALLGLFSDLGVPERGRVLDLACGIGRHAVPLAKRGYDVTGVDFSPLFIEKARQYAAEQGVHAEFLVGDALDVEDVLKGEEPYDAIINMFTSHAYYGREGDVKMFGGLTALARPGGVLVVMTVNRDFVIRHYQRERWESAGMHSIRQRQSVDLESSVINNTWEIWDVMPILADPRVSVDISLRVYSLHEMRALLEETGWAYLRGMGAETKREVIRLVPLDADSSRMWVAGRRKIRKAATRETQD